jgi:hypothetical protein
MHFPAFGTVRADVMRGTTPNARHWQVQLFMYDGISEARTLQPHLIENANVCSKVSISQKARLLGTYGLAYKVRLQQLSTCSPPPT